MKIQNTTWVRWAFISAFSILTFACGGAFDAAPQSANDNPDAELDTGDSGEPLIDPDVSPEDVPQEVSEPEGCPEGERHLFLDGDGDGVGLETTEECAAEAPEGFVFEGGDCDDGDETVYRSAILFVDSDNDGYTGAGQSVCIGDAIPEGLSEVAFRPPEEALGPGLAVDNGMGEDWDDLENLREPDGRRARCKLDEGEDPCSELIATGFGLQIPSGAQILGVEVILSGRVRRRQMVLGESFQLLVGGRPVGDVRRNDIPWDRETNTLRIYGSPGDLWGVGWTAEMLSGAGFGVVFSVPPLEENTNEVNVDVDHIAVRVYHDMAFDCDDGDEEVWSPGAGFVDADGDGFAGQEPGRFCAGKRRAAGFGPISDDCYDDNALARPGGGAQAADRGDGSFDYNCDGTEDAVAIFGDISCTFEPEAMICRGAQTSIDPTAPCGEINRCITNNGGCSLQGQEEVTRCR